MDGPKDCNTNEVSQTEKDKYTISLNVKSKKKEKRYIQYCCQRLVRCSLILFSTQAHKEYISQALPQSDWGRMMVSSQWIMIENNICSF